MGLAGDQLSDRVVDGDVCTPESVDGLFWIADDRQSILGEHDVLPSRRFGRRLAKEKKDLGLEWICVLELVHEDVVEVPLQRATHDKIRLQNITKEQKEVDIVDHAFSSLCALIERNERGKHARKT